MLDLHIHTTASDGTLAPEQVVRLGAQRGFSLLAVTDHDTMDGVPEALAAGARAGVRVLPGVEISSGVALEVHLLGYGMSPDHPVMREMLEDMRRARVERMGRIIENLQGMGIPIEVEEVEALAGSAGRTSPACSCSTAWCRTCARPFASTSAWARAPMPSAER